MSFTRLAESHRITNMLAEALGMTDHHLTHAEITSGARSPIRFKIEGVLSTEQAHKFFALCGAAAEVPAPDVWEHA